jgi:hypothetical protein
MDYPKICRSDNTVLYTAHFATELWDLIETFCEANGFKSWQKAPNAEPEDVVSLVQK